MDINDISAFLDTLANEIQFSNQQPLPPVVTNGVTSTITNSDVNGIGQGTTQTNSQPSSQNNNPTTNGLPNGTTATPSPPPETGALPVQLPVRKSRKGPAPKLFGNELCKICDSKATGFHYNVLSCEACKNFFRRAVVHHLKYECKTGQRNCSVRTGHSIPRRPRCQYCRLSKCKDAGMKTDYINRGKPNKNSPPEPSIGEPYKTIIDDILSAWKEMDTLTDDELQAMNIGQNLNCGQKEAFLFMSQCAATKVRKIVHFCKRLPLWANLNEDIQIRLIKGGLTEAMILFNTRDYDSKRDEVKFMDGKSRSKEAFYASGFNSEMIDEMFNIWKYCHKYRLADQISIALITAAVLTSPDRQLMTNSGESDRRDVLPVVNDLHIGIITSLHLHLSIIDRKNHSFPKAMMLLVKLRKISDGLMPSQLQHFCAQGLKMNPLLQEIYG